MNHVEVRAIVIPAFHRQFPDVVSPPLCVYQALQGVGGLESNYGKGWQSAEGKLSNNVGCVQGGKPPCNPATSFQAVDTHPTADGGAVPYHICFKKYPTPLDGWADVARIMYREITVGGERVRPALEAALRGDLYGVSAGMYQQRYYEGRGKTVQDRIANHHRALEACVRRAAIAIGEPMPGAEDPPRATIRRGSHGPAVKEWQLFLNEQLHEAPLVTDGAFGKLTEARTIAWQRSHGLHPDGIVGPRTWALAESM